MEDLTSMGSKKSLLVQDFGTGTRWPAGFADNCRSVPTHGNLFGGSWQLFDGILQAT